MRESCEVLYGLLQHPLHPRWMYPHRIWCLVPSRCQGDLFFKEKLLSIDLKILQLGLPELPGRQLCEHSNLPDDRRWCDLPGGLLGLLWRLEGEQVPDLHLRFLPRCYPCRSGTTS